MSKDLIQAQYEQLARVASNFNGHAAANQQLIQNIRQHADALRDRGLIGLTEHAFVREMDEKLYPALNRLSNALEYGGQVTLKISEIMQRAEDEAAAPFQGSGNNTIGIATREASSENSVPFWGNMVLMPATEKNIADRIEANGDIWSFGKGEHAGIFKPEIKATINFDKSTVWGHGISTDNRHGELGLKVSKEGLLIGGGGEYYAIKGKWDTVLNDEYGVIGGIEAKGLGGTGFAGAKIDRDGARFGANIGFNLVSVEGSIGYNVAGHNVSLTGEIGLKAELGIEWGKKIKIRAPFFSVGFKIGDEVK